MTDSLESIDETRDYLVAVKSDAKKLTQSDLAALIDIYGTKRNDKVANTDYEDDDDDGGPDALPPTEKVYQLFPALMSYDDTLSAEAEHIAEELAAKHVAAIDESGLPGEKFLYTFHDELFDGESARLDEGVHVAAIMGSRKSRAHPSNEVYPPARVIHRFIDKNASPQRAYYFLLGHNSAHEPILEDLREIFTKIGVTLDHQSGYTRPHVLAAILSLWPDLTHLRTGF
ncbi:hypothetical protein GCM10007304_11570 [Rhodococcoides trifolii]|uniref:Uncharacterized protein n=2 Tax=Rhodococcoides trifolii TaxID=908250 RepID=A0A917FQB3_9NOCA|nr:hypothetical protein GCM10007304_11570 [Rhodococcus trifolii]